MSFIKGIFERATIRGIADYLLFGLGPDEDTEIMKNVWKSLICGLKRLSLSMTKFKFKTIGIIE